MHMDDVYAEDGRPLRLKYIEYIKENFADLLGADLMLLDQPGGLEQLGDKYFHLMASRKSRQATSAA